VVHEDRTPVVTAHLPVSTSAFVAACAIAGALAVPVDAVASPVSTFLAGLVGFLGLRLWRWSGLPRLLKADAPAGLGRLVLPAASLGLGLIIGLLLLGAIRLAIEPTIPAAGVRIAAAGAVPVWRRVVIIYVAAVGEELVFRLVLLSAVAGLTTRLLRGAAGVPSRAVTWGATVLSALAFAAAHLPAWSAMGPPSLGLAFVVMTLNGVSGLAFGYVFVTRGNVAAMWTHAGADCAIHLIGPLTR
jgi:membrane protease YdiL (CAAX protease family)